MKTLLRLTVVMGIVFSGWGCLGINPTHLERLYFNERILEGYAPIGPNQTDQDYATSQYRSGQPHRFIDELIPVLPGVREDVINQLWHADCFWVAMPDQDTPHNFMVSWEVVAQLRDTPNELFVPGNDLVALCTGSHPTNRIPLKDPDGDPVNMRYVTSVSHSANLTVSLLSVLTQPWDNPPSECTIPTDAGGLVIGVYRGGCVNDVPIRVTRDQTIKLLARAAGGSGDRYLKPSIKVVGRHRVMERRMQFKKIDIEEGVTRHKYSWSTMNTDGSWTDNFSPRLYVSQVRFYKKGRNGNKRYLTPFRFKIRKLDQPIMSCYPNPIGDPNGSDFFIAEGCDPARSVTPAYFHDHPGDPIEWEVAFNNNPLLDDTHRPDTREIYIEFILRPYFGDSVIRATPYLDFNHVAQSLTSVKTARIDNIGNLPVQIRAVELLGADRNDFGLNYAPPLNLNPPFALAAGHSLPIEITAAPSSLGRKTAILKVETVDSQTITQLVMISGQDPFVEVLPSTVDMHAVHTPWRAVAVSNPGTLPATVTWTLTGRNPQYFQVLVSPATSANPRPAPMPSPFTLQPGYGETVYLRYAHTGLDRAGPDALTDRAQIIFQVDGSEAEYPVDITGVYVPFPAPPARP